jgi:predicted amidohydrolase
LRKSGELLSPIKKAAKKGKIYVIVPTNIMLNNKLYNRAYLIDRNGELMGFYEKCFGFYDRTIGNKYPIFRTNFGTIGIAICYDLGFEEPVRRLANNGAKIIFAPIYYGANEKGDQAQFVKCVPFTRSYENKVFVAAVNVAEGFHTLVFVHQEEK